MSQEDMDIEMLTETEKSTIIDIEDYINDEASDINDFNFNEEFEHEALLQLIENHNNINNQLSAYFGKLQEITLKYEGRDKKTIYGELVNELYNLRSIINAISDDNNKIIRHLNKKLAEMGTNESASSDASIEDSNSPTHIFLFTCHGKEYNVSGQRNYYPFQHDLFDSIGIISEYGLTANGDDLRDKLTLTENIHHVLNCPDVNINIIQEGQSFVAINPLSLSFRYHDENNEYLSPYMGLFYIKAQQLENNETRLLKMEHIVSFANKIPLIKIPNQDLIHIDENEQHKYTLHDIDYSQGYGTIQSNFGHNEDFGWDRVLNLISRFYRAGLDIDDGDRKLIREGEEVHIRMYTCRGEERKTTGKKGKKNHPETQMDYVLYESIPIEYKEDHIVRSFNLDSENIVNLSRNIPIFQTFINDFVVMTGISVNINVLFIYLLTLIDKDIQYNTPKQKTNVHMLVERVITIFSNVGEQSLEQLFVMLTSNKEGVHEYKLKKLDISEFSVSEYSTEETELLQFLVDLLQNDLSRVIANLNVMNGIKIYFLGNNVVPSVLFIFFQNNQAYVSLEYIYVQGQQHVYNHQETELVDFADVFISITKILQDNFTSIKIIYSNNILKGGMNKYGMSLKNKLEQRKKPSKYIQPENSIIVEANEELTERDKQLQQIYNTPPNIFPFKTSVSKPNPNFGLKKPVEHDSQGTDIDFTTPGSTPRFPDSAYISPDITPNRTMTAPGSGYTDTEISPGDIKRGRPKRSVSPSTSTSRVNKGLTYADSKLPVSSMKRSPKSWDDLPAEAQKALQGENPLTMSVESNKTDDSEGYTQEEEFGGKKKGKKGKKTKRAKKVKKTKKARKTKKKRSNKK